MDWVAAAALAKAMRPLSFSPKVSHRFHHETANLGALGTSISSERYKRCFGLATAELAIVFLSGMDIVSEQVVVSRFQSGTATVIHCRGGPASTLGNK